MRVVGEALGLTESTARSTTVSVAGGHKLTITILGANMIRVRLDRDSSRTLERSWMVAPKVEAGVGDAPYEGRCKNSLDGFASWDEPSVTATDDFIQVSTKTLRVIVPLKLSPLALRWEYFDDAEWRPLLTDRKTGAYYFGRRDERLCHHVSRRRGDRFFGLGEKSGGLDKSGRRYRMDCHDALGYDAEQSDPLYKFWPFYIARPADGEVSYGLFYDNPTNCTFDLGCAFDNYHSYFSSYEAVCGDLDYTVLLGPRVRDVVRRFSRLIGGTALPPLWSLGYSGSTMSYTDAPDAQVRRLSPPLPTMSPAPAALLTLRSASIMPVRRRAWASFCGCAPPTTSHARPSR